MKKLANSFFVIALSFGLSLSAQGAGDLDNQLTQIVRNAGVLSPDIAKSAAVAHQSTANGFTATISAYRNTKANDNDCKIDAVLLAKKIHDKFPNAQDIMVVFYDVSRTAYRSVTIRSGDLDVFRSGALNKDRFLQMLTVVKSTNRGAGGGTSISQQVMEYHVPDGAYKIQRQQMLLSLQDIIQHHGDVSNLWGPFLNLEHLAQSGEIDEYNLEQVKLAKRVNEANGYAQEQFGAELRRAQTEKLMKDAEILGAQGSVHPGPEYQRRERLALVISHRQAQGVNMNIYSQILYGEIEPKAQTNSPDLDQMITQLETALALPPIR